MPIFFKIFKNWIYAHLDIYPFPPVSGIMLSAGAHPSATIEMWDNTRLGDNTRRLRDNSRRYRGAPAPTPSRPKRFYL